MLGADTWTFLAVYCPHVTRCCIARSTKVVLNKSRLSKQPKTQNRDEQHEEADHKAPHKAQQGAQDGGRGDNGLAGEDRTINNHKSRWDNQDRQQEEREESWPEQGKTKILTKKDQENMTSNITTVEQNLITHRTTAIKEKTQDPPPPKKKNLHHDIRDFLHLSSFFSHTTCT